MQIAGWLLGLLRRDGDWHHARDACRAARRRRRAKTHFKIQSAAEGGRLLSSPFLFIYLFLSALCSSGGVGNFTLSHGSVYSFICPSLCFTVCPPPSLSPVYFLLFFTDFVAFSQLQGVVLMFLDGSNGGSSWDCQVGMIKLRLEMGLGN